MTDLTPITALGTATARVQSFGALTIAENASLALASLALRKGQAAPAPFGLTLPGVAQWVAGDTIAVFWTGPDQWMVEANGQGDTDFAAVLKAQAPDCAVTEQTDGWVTFEISSAQGAAGIESLMTRLINLDTAELAPGRAARTGLEHMSVFVIRRAEDQLAVMGMRTLADALWHALAVTAERLETRR